MKLKKKTRIVNKHIKLDAEFDNEVMSRLKKMKGSYSIDFSKLVRGLLEDWMKKETK